LPKNVLSDCIIEFTEYKATKDYPKQLRLVRFFDEEQEPLANRTVLQMAKAAPQD
ncbi:hypothetical protein T12_886, partial [Trichinella patagoniensis]